MLMNVVDKRTNSYKWEVVDVAVEPTWHDNCIEGADQAPRMIGEKLGYEDRTRITLTEAVAWAQSLPYNATLYIYDFGSLSRSYTTEEIQEKEKERSKTMEERMTGLYNFWSDGFQCVKLRDVLEALRHK
jgi:hypothetical protein